MSGWLPTDAPQPGQRGFCSQTPLSPSPCLRHLLWGRRSSRGQGRRASAVHCLREPPLGHAGPSAGRAWRNGAAPASSTDRAGETLRETWVGSGAWRDGRMRGGTRTVPGPSQDPTFLSFPASVACVRGQSQGALDRGWRSAAPSPSSSVLHPPHSVLPRLPFGQAGGQQGSGCYRRPPGQGGVRGGKWRVLDLLPRSETGWQLQPEPASRNALPGPVPSRGSAKLCGPGRGDASRRR